MYQKVNAFFHAAYSSGKSTSNNKKIPSTETPEAYLRLAVK